MNKLYAAYNALGGNGIITTIWENINDLPLKQWKELGTY